MAILTNSFTHFLVSLIISAIIIYIITKLLGEEEGIITAGLAAFFGSLISVFSVKFFGDSLLATVIGGVTWLLALRILYSIGWIKSLLIAILVGLVSLLLQMFV